MIKKTIPLEKVLTQEEAFEKIGDIFHEWGTRRNCLAKVLATIPRAYKFDELPTITAMRGVRDVLLRMKCDKCDE